MICLSILKQVNRKAIKFVYLQTNYFVNHVNVCPNFQVQGVYGNRNSCLLRWKRPAHEAITQKATVLCRLLSVWLISNVKRAQCTFRDALRWWPAWRRWVSRQQKGLWSAWGSSASAYLCLTDIHSKRLNLSQSIQVIDVYQLFGCGPLVFLPVPQSSVMDPQNTGGLQSLQKSDFSHLSPILPLTCSS